MIVKMDSNQIDAKNRDDFHRLLHDVALAFLRKQKEKVCPMPIEFTIKFDAIN